MQSSKDFRRCDVIRYLIYGIKLLRRDAGKAEDYDSLTHEGAGTTMVLGVELHVTWHQVFKHLQVATFRSRPQSIATVAVTVVDVTACSSSKRKSTIQMSNMNNT